MTVTLGLIMLLVVSASTTAVQQSPLWTAGIYLGLDPVVVEDLVLIAPMTDAVTGGALQARGLRDGVLRWS
jgi:hypothetical protein